MDYLQEIRDSECGISAFIAGDVILRQEPLETDHISSFVYSLRVDISNNISSLYSRLSGPGSVVGIATAYGLDGPGIEYRWGEIFRTSPDRP